MKARPILFSTPMVQALLEGRKTQTRRIIKPQPEMKPEGFTWHKDLPNNRMFACVSTNGEPTFGMKFYCPYGMPGDLLYVREAWRTKSFALDPIKPSELDSVERILYEADNLRTINGKLRPSIFMPRWASRLTLEITSIRVERLQDISQDDAIDEGIAPLFTEIQATQRQECNLSPMPWRNYLWHGNFGKYGTGNAKSDAWPHQYSSYRHDDAKGAYSSLWESINGKGSWDANPWVWVVEFKVHKCNVDNFNQGASSYEKKKPK